MFLQLMAPVAEQWNKNTKFKMKNSPQRYWDRGNTGRNNSCHIPGINNTQDGYSILIDLLSSKTLPQPSLASKGQL